MAQITWRNVNAPSFEGPLEAIGDANEDIISGFDPFKKILTDHQKLQEENFIQQGENVDTGIQANLQKLKSLGELNQAEDAGQFDIGTIEQQYGKMANFDKLTKNVAKQRTDLRADALSIASGIGTQAANDGKDITLGSKAVYEDLIAKGADNDWALQQASKWEQGAGVLQNKFNKERKDATDTFLLNTGPITSPVKIQETIDAGKQQGIKANWDVVQQKLTQEMSANRTESIYQRQEANRVALNAFNTDFLKNINNGMDPAQAVQVGAKKANLNGTQQIAASNMAIGYAEQKQKLKGPQEEMYNQLKLEADSQLTQQQADATAHIDSLKQQLSNVTGLDENTKTFAEKTVLQDGGMVGEIMKSLTKTGKVEPSDWWSALKTSPGTVSSILNNKLQQLRSLPGINDVDANSLLWLAYQDSVGDSYGFGGAKGVAPKALDATIRARMRQYNDGKAIRQQIITDSKSLKRELEKAAVAKSGALLGWRQEQRKGNLSGTVNNGSFVEQMSTAFSKLPNESSPTLQKQSLIEAKAAFKRALENNSAISKQVRDQLTKDIKQMSAVEFEKTIKKLGGVTHTGVPVEIIKKLKSGDFTKGTSRRLKKDRDSFLRALPVNLNK